MAALRTVRDFLRFLFHALMADWHRGTAHSRLHHRDEPGFLYHRALASKHDRLAGGAP